MYIVKSKYVEVYNKVYKEQNYKCDTLIEAAMIRDKMMDDYIDLICPYIIISSLQSVFNLYCINDKDKYFDLIYNIKSSLIVNSIKLMYETQKLKKEFDIDINNDINIETFEITIEEI